ncbi:probable G-protein coupled receptor 19 [Strongylocentrotus purpuratus]|uniref:Probable G-protein coupled receptor 19 n=1 Tax=Strongylocentrotus purpuratus TaxID=7668 RepID=A0A7M7GK65_STRPU|nr:probable G-protein coupled receptor 19 [Strongylocentrotus purpuratus]
MSATTPLISGVFGEATEFVTSNTDMAIEGRLVTTELSTSPWEQPTLPGPDPGTTPQNQDQDNIVMTFGTVMGTIAASLMCMTCIFGNILVVTVVQRSRRLQSTTNYFVISLAIVDLVMSVLCMPFMIGLIIADEWVYGVFICKLVRFLQYMKPGATVYVLIAIGVDRFYTILYPLSFKITRGKAKKMIIISWSIATLISCPAFYFFMLTELAGNKTVCTPFVSFEAAGIMYITALLLIEFILPLVLLLITYARIFRHIWTVGIRGRALQRTMNSVPRAKVKTVKMLMIVSSVFFVSWTPFFVVQEWFTCAKDMSEISQSEVNIYWATVWVSLTSCAWNPVIYSCYNPNFRRGCKEVFCVSTMKCYRKDTYAITNSSKFSRKNHVGVLTEDVDGGRSFTSYRAFDRDANGDKKMAWPLPTTTSTTYL